MATAVQHILCVRSIFAEQFVRPATRYGQFAEYTFVCEYNENCVHAIGSPKWLLVHIATVQNCCAVWLCCSHAHTDAGNTNAAHALHIIYLESRKRCVKVKRQPLSGSHSFAYTQQTHTAHTRSDANLVCTRVSIPKLTECL